jgi:hypothetical protein
LDEVARYKRVKNEDEAVVNTKVNIEYEVARDR